MLRANAALSVLADLEMVMRRRCEEMKSEVAEVLVSGVTGALDSQWQMLNENISAMQDEWKEKMNTVVEFLRMQDEEMNNMRDAALRVSVQIDELQSCRMAEKLLRKVWWRWISWAHGKLQQRKAADVLHGSLIFVRRAEYFWRWIAFVLLARSRCDARAKTPAKFELITSLGVQNRKVDVAHLMVQSVNVARASFGDETLEVAENSVCSIAGVEEVVGGASAADVLSRSLPIDVDVAAAELKVVQVAEPDASGPNVVLGGGACDGNAAGIPCGVCNENMCVIMSTMYERELFFCRCRGGAQRTRRSNFDGRISIADSFSAGFGGICRCYSSQPDGRPNNLRVTENIEGLHRLASHQAFVVRVEPGIARKKTISSKKPGPRLVGLSRIIEKSASNGGNVAAKELPRWRKW